MLKADTIDNYTKDYHPQWVMEMPAGCPPAEIMVPFSHPFFRLAHHADIYDENDFKSYAEIDSQKNWGERLPMAVGLSLIDNESKARKNLKLPMFRQYKGICLGSQRNRVFPEESHKETGVYSAGKRRAPGCDPGDPYL